MNILFFPPLSFPNFLMLHVHTRTQKRKRKNARKPTKKLPTEEYCICVRALWSHFRIHFNLVLYAWRLFYIGAWNRVYSWRNDKCQYGPFLSSHVSLGVTWCTLPLILADSLSPSNQKCFSFPWKITSPLAIIIIIIFKSKKNKVIAKECVHSRFLFVWGRNTPKNPFHPRRLSFSLSLSLSLSLCVCLCLALCVSLCVCLSLSLSLSLSKILGEWFKRHVISETWFILTKRKI